MDMKQDIITLIKDIPDSEYLSLKNYLLFLKHKSYLTQLENDRKEEIQLLTRSTSYVFSENRDEDSAYETI